MAGIADILGNLTSNIISASPVGGIVNVIGGWLGSGKKEDTSTVGYSNFLKSYNTLPAYPTKDEMIAASKSGNWNKGQSEAVVNTYNPSTGTLNEGDWHGEVVNVNPIQVRWFKGASESGLSTSTTVSAQAAQSASFKTNNVFQVPVAHITQSVFKSGTSPTIQSYQQVGGNGGPQATTTNFWPWIIGGISLVGTIILIVISLARKR